MYSPNFTVDNKIFCLSLHYNGDNSYLFVNGKQVINFKAKNSELIKYPMCLGGLSKDYDTNSRKDTELYGNAYDFSVDYSAITNDEILDIHKYLIKKNNIVEMLRFIKKCFFTAITFFSPNVLNVNSLECVSMNNQECKIRSEIININTNEPMYYPYSIKTNKCKGSCNTIINVKVFNLMSRTNETRHIEWHKTCKCKCRLDTSVCNNKQRWNEDKCRCECN